MRRVSWAVGGVIAGAVACQSAAPASSAAGLGSAAASAAALVAGLGSAAGSRARDEPAGRAEMAALCAHYECRAEADGIRLPDGVRVAWDDGRAKTTEERIEHPDVEDVFALRYPAPGSAIVPVTDVEIDPGRVRLEALFRATYGADARAVSSAMVPVKIAGHTVSFHRRAAPALERVAARVARLLVEQPSLARYFGNLGGTFNPRLIAGTTHASAHSWAIAIDIDVAHADYWRNGPPPPRWRNRIPQAIVDAFEAESFVWGGRWFHYDTMHFEYRPELFTTAAGGGSGASGAAADAGAGAAAGSPAGANSRAGAAAADSSAVAGSPSGAAAPGSPDSR